MTWIATVPYEEATGRLKTLYDRVKGPDDNVDNIMMAAPTPSAPPSKRTRRSRPSRAPSWKCAAMPRN